jgi:Flp pilus assembly protein TadD
MSDLPDRIKRFQEHAKRFPDSELPHFALGKALLEAGREEEAMAEFRETLRIKPDYLIPHILLARLLMDHGKKEEARDLVRKARPLALAQGHEGPVKDIEELEKELI